MWFGLFGVKIGMMTYLISYDISDDGLRTHLSKLLERNGLRRIQKSVFISSDCSLKEIRLLRKEVKALLQVRKAIDADSVICVPMSQSQVEELWWKTPKPLPDFVPDIVLWI